MGTALNLFEVDNVRGLEKIGGFGGRADQLNLFHTFGGDPNLINTDIERYRAVTAEDVVRVAVQSLGANRIRMTVLTEDAVEAGAGADIDRSTMPGSAVASLLQPAGPATRETGQRSQRSCTSRTPRLPGGVDESHRRCRSATGDPPDKPGLSHLTAVMLPEGTPTMTSLEIAEEMEFIGAHLGSSAGYEQVSASTSALTQHRGRAMEILADVVTHASFPEHELERVRKERLVDLRRIADDPNLIAQRAFRALLHGKGTPYGSPLSGTEDSIGAITRDEIVEQFQRTYVADATTLIVVGDTTRDDVPESLAQARLGHWSPGAERQTPSTKHQAPSTPATVSTTIFLADKPGAAQSVIRAGHLTIDRHDPDYYALNLLNYLFGGHFMARMNQNLRQDKGYSYGFHSAVDWSTGPSALAAWGSVQTAVTKESVIEVLKEFEDIRTGRPVGEEEFADAKNGLLKGFPGQFETQTHLLSQLGHIVMFGLPDDYYSHA